MSDHREKQVIALVAGELNREPERLKPSDDFINDLHADSIDTANIIGSVKITFGVLITMEEAEKIETIQNLIDCINEKKAR